MTLLINAPKPPAAGSVTLDSLSPQIRSFVENEANVDSYGAVGDGTTDDTVAILAAIADAGAGGVVRFSSGKTYIHSARLEPMTNQLWTGRGATIKRAAEIVKTTTTGITAGAAPKTVTLNNVTGLSVGKSVSFKNGSTLESGYHVITAINGSTVTLDTTFPDTWAIGSQMITSFPQITSINPGVVLDGLILDGNYSQNTTYARWEVSACIRLGSAGATITGCTFLNSQADAVMIDAGYVTVQNCRIQDCRGNGIHLSGASYCRILNNTLININTGPASIGHVDGAIIASNSVGYTEVIGNMVVGALCGVASWDSADNSHLVCTNNVIKSCTGSAFEGLVPSTTSYASIIFSDNDIEDCVEISVYSTHGATPRDTGPSRVRITNNLIHNTKVAIYNAFDVVFEGNTVTTSSVTMLMEVYGGRNIRIAGNILRGGNQAIYFPGSTIGLVIADNLMTDQMNYGIRFEGAIGKGGKIANNTIIANDAASSGWYGAYLQDECNFLDNLVVSTHSGSPVGIYCAPDKAIIARNILKSATGVAMAVSSGGTKLVVVNNMSSVAITGTGTGGSIVSNNTVLP